jgi:hypothetical protein
MTLDEFRKTHEKDREGHQHGDDRQVPKPPSRAARDFEAAPERHRTRLVQMGPEDAETMAAKMESCLAVNYKHEDAFIDSL